MKLFFAVQPPPGIRAALARASEEIRGRMGRTRASWVSADNMHFTLVFIGETDPGLLEGLRAIGSRAAESCAAGELKFGNFGAFPNLRAPRVLWAGLAQGAGGLEGLAGELARGLDDAKIAFDPKPFKPHLTLARVREPLRTPSGVALLEGLAAPSESWSARELILFESLQEGIPPKPVYRDSGRFLLGA
jgi:2'-5' RNA ligase